MCVYLVTYELKNKNYISAAEKLDNVLGSSHFPVRDGLCVIVSGPHAQNVQSNLNFVLGQENIHSLIIVRVSDDYALVLPPQAYEAQTYMENVFPRRRGTF